MQLGVRGAVGAHLPHGQHMGAVDALGQPEAAGADGLHLVMGLLPEFHRHGTGHVAAEAVHDGGPLLQCVDLIAPQIAVGVVQIHDVPPVGHLAGGLALLIPQEELRVLGGQHGVRRGVVIHYVDDALHAPVVDGVHQMAQVVDGAHVGVHRPVVPDGVGAAHGALAALLADGVDGHQPQDIRTQPLQAVEVALQGTEGALLRVSADENAVNDLVPQGEIGVACHRKALLCQSNLLRWFIAASRGTRPPSVRGCSVPAPCAACFRRSHRPPHRWFSWIPSRWPCRHAARSWRRPRPG